MRYRLAWFLGFSLLVAPLAAQAQGDTASGLGVKLGLTITNFGGDDADAIPFIEFENKLGFAVGGMIELPLAPLVSLQPELMVVTKGADVELLGDDVGYTTLRYLEIPILVRRNIPMGDSAVLFVVAGPGLGVLLSAKNVENDGGTQDIEDEIKDLDIGVIVGGGVGVPLSSGGAFELEVRYEHGLVSIEEGEDLGLENRAVFVLGGYRF